MFSPAHHRLRLLHISDLAAAYAMRWTHRIVIVSVVGYAIAEVGLLLGLSDTAHDALLKTVGLIDHVFRHPEVFSAANAVLRSMDMDSLPGVDQAQAVERVMDWRRTQISARASPHGSARR